MMPVRRFASRLRAFVAILPVLLCFFCGTAANACKCSFDSLSLQNIKSSELIFLGEVSAVSGCSGTSKATFTVKELFRGKCYQNVAVEFDCTSDCQMSFAPGQTWIIYATYKKYGEPVTEFCSFSRQKMPAGEEDFNSSWHGKTFDEEEAWLKKNLGLQELNERNPIDDQHHENIRPTGYETLWYLGGGFLALIVLYFISRKFLK
jgi:hypothetical protein